MGLLDSLLQEMAYSFQPLDQALDNLGKSYIDGVTVKIASKYLVDCDLDQVKKIVNKPVPSVLSFESNYDTSYEKKVLEDIAKRSAEHLKKDKERKERIDKYVNDRADKLARKQKEEEEKALEDERKRLLEIEAEKKAKVAEEELKQQEKLKAEEERILQQKLEEEAEWKRFEEERIENTKASSSVAEVEPVISTDKSEEGSDEVFTTPPEESGPTSSTQIQVKGTHSAQAVQNPKINFSDFEALSDPFADLELQTINDLAELQTILTSNTMPVQAQSNTTTALPSNGALGGQFSQNFGGGISGHPQPPPPSTTSFYSSIPSQNQFSNHLRNQPPAQSNFANFSRYSSTGSPGYNPSFTSTAYTPYPGYSPAQPYPGTGYSVYNPGQVQPSYPPVTNTQGGRGARSISSDRRTEKLKDSPEHSSKTQSNTSGELKPSRSVGDIISELQKDAQSLQDQKRKSPNPNSRPGSRGATGLENWTPWPKLDQKNQGGITERSKPVEDESCLIGISVDEARMCRQLHEMGFPLSRLVKGCQAVGNDSQKLINFCLVVDRLVDEGFSIPDSEEVAMLHNADEEVCRKHLKSFQQLAEIGFPSKDVHQALIASSFDHQKALEQLIG